MTSFSKFILFVGVLFTSLCQLTAQGRQVIIGLDESGSMSSSWDELNYALQTIIALIDENDDLVIVRANALKTMTINTKNKQAEVATWYREPANTASGEAKMIVAASDILKQNSNKEALVIFIGDGSWGGTSSACSTLSTAFQQHKKRPRIIFFKIGNSNTSGFEKDLLGQSSLKVETIFTASEDETALKNNLNKLANIIVEGKQGKVKVSRSGSSIVFEPIFPLKKVIVLIQNRGCSITSVNRGYKLNSPIEMTNIGIGGNLSGKCYEIFANDKSIISTSSKISLKCSGGGCCNPSSSDFKIIPIVDLDLVSKPEGEFIFSDPDKKIYHVCKKTNEVSIKSFLQDLKGKKIQLSGLSDLKIKAHNGSTSTTLSFGADQAIGKIKLLSETTIVEVEATYEGYFQKKTAFTFIKKPCPLKLDAEVSGKIANRDDTKQIYEICPDVKTIDLKATIIDDIGTKKAFSSFKLVDAYFKVNGKEIALSEENDEFSGTLTLNLEDTEVTLLLKTDGAIFETKQYKFKRILCGAERDFTDLEVGQLPVMEFTSEGKCIENIKVLRSNGVEIDYSKYDFKLSDIPFEFNVELDLSDTYPKLCLKKKPYLCDCFIRNGTFSGTITALPKEPGLPEVNKKWTITLVKKNSLWERCKICVILFIILFVLGCYIFGIWQKPRFHNSAKFEVVEEDKTAMYAPPRKLPSKSLRTNFFNRYLVPFVAESKIINGLKFKASNNKNSIFLAKESFSEKLSKNGDPLTAKSKRDLKFFKNNTLEQEKNQQKIVKYTLKVK